MFIYLSINRSIDRSNYLSNYLSVCLSDCLSVCLSVCLSAGLSVCLPTYLPTYLRAEFSCIPLIDIFGDYIRVSPVEFCIAGEISFKMSKVSFSKDTVEWQPWLFIAPKHSSLVPVAHISYCCFLEFAEHAYHLQSKWSSPRKHSQRTLFSKSLGAGD